LHEEIGHSDESERSPMFKTIDKVLELGVTLINFYFVLELVPAIILIDPNVDTKEMTE
jgi:hypothetical protein